MMIPRVLKPRFTIGGLLAATALVCAYMTTGLYADDALAQSIAAILNPMLLLVAIIAWCEPGRLGKIVGYIHHQLRAMLATGDKVDDE